MLRKRDSPLVLKLVDLARKQHIIPIRYANAKVRTFVASRALNALGADAKSAVPELMSIFDQNISEESQADIAEVFPRSGASRAKMCRKRPKTDDFAESECSTLSTVDIPNESLHLE